MTLLEQEEERIKAELEEQRAAMEKTFIEYLEFAEGTAPKSSRETNLKTLNTVQEWTERIIKTFPEIAEPIESRAKKTELKLMGETLTESRFNAINQDPFTKALLQRKQGAIYAGTSPDTGEIAEINIVNGYITPYEKEIIESIAKFKADGQTTERGKTWFTLGQLYRAMRHGAGTTSPLKTQKETLLQALNELERPERKIFYSLNEAVQTWGGFDKIGGRIRVISFDEEYGKYRGQEDILIILDNTPIICEIAERLKMVETIDQSIKAIITYKEGQKPRKWNLTENRIALRSVILDFVYTYIRARAANKCQSNKLPYKKIFELCKIDTKSRETTKRAKKDIAVILEHLKRCEALPELKDWKEYTNKRSTAADGIEIFLKVPEIEVK